MPDSAAKVAIGGVSTTDFAQNKGILVKCSFSNSNLRVHIAKVTNVSSHGFWLLLEAEELFLPFVEFPWFRDAAIGKLLNVELPSPGHLYWPDLDVDLAVESIRHPDRFPLISRVGV